ncbi:MAG TPA: DnaJ domain-containing protein [Hyphomicrobiaceae bacterium]|nr:DnaJ domain-containing protein [Hyphomicrobiaceae bacterium]
MQALLLGFAVLVLGLVLAHTTSSAQRRDLIRKSGAAVGLLLLTIAVIMSSRGLAMFAMPLAMLGLWLFSQRIAPGRGWGQQPQKPTVQTSRVVTEFLEMELDLDSGAMQGQIRKGVFAGRDIEGMAPAELALLWQDCRFEDPQSAQLVEAYLDNIHPSWREDMTRAEAETGAGGKLTVQEAREILGVSLDATASEIRQAHRELMKKFHPDRGGSAYLATKINEAKEILLGR